MTEHPIRAMTELRESLREAARRDIAARAPKRRRRRVTFGVFAVLLGCAAAAGAADLISTGEPVKSPYQQADRYNPRDELQIAVKATDDPLPWAVVIYDAKDGQKCAVVGQLRGVKLGQMSGGTFHPYEANHQAACGQARRTGLLVLDGHRAPNRTIYYGRVAPGTKHVYAVVDGERIPADTGAGGAFVFVFRGEGVKPSSFSTG